MSWKRRLVRLGLAALLAGLGGVGCDDADGSATKKARSAPARPSASAYKSVRIDGVPHVKQRCDFCGEACAEMWLRKLGYRNLDQDHIFDRSGVSPLAARGCRTAELAAALEQIGLRVGGVWYRVAAAKAAEQMEAQWRAVHGDLLAGIPSIVCMRTGEGANASEHFRLVLGYDAQADEAIYHEPAEAGGAYRRIKRQQLLKLWPLKYDAATWTAIRLRLEAGRIREADPPTTFTNADYAQHVMKLKSKIPQGGGFTIVMQPPFVVIGDESPAAVRRRAEGTVGWAVRMLKKDFFGKDPAEILDIWLFKDEASYRKHARGIFGDNPSTPFGYYSSSQKALIMNIATGGGTLVHEIVHPFVAANFPNCPAWLNEGLGSLYEQCHERDGKIMGLTNWRLPGLQKAIRAGRVPSLRQLTATTTHQFYSRDPGTNYAQARYLCYYLQERGLLRKFYHAFAAAHKRDPTGYETLKKVLGTQDMAAFQKTWEAWVLTLRFP